MTVLLVAAVGLSGCAQLREKFVRKPKEEKAASRRYCAVKAYDIRPSLELYTKRYVFWKTWHKELLAVLGGSNHKKTLVAIEQEIVNLRDMRNMLIDEKAEELQKPIDEIMKIETALKKEKVTRGNEVRMRRRLESLGRQVKRNFSYTKVRGVIRDDFRRE